MKIPAVAKLLVAAIVRGAAASDYVFACRPNDPRINAISECPYEPDELLSVKWEASFIFLSYAYAMMGAYLTVMCIRRLFHVRDFKWFLALSTIAGLGLGGCGVWTMHFVGMKALYIGNKDIEISVNGDTKQVTAVLEVEFEVFMTVFSLLAACAISSAGVAWISYRDFLSMGRAWNAPELKINVVTVVLAAGVCIMHYMGMWAQSSKFKIEWDPGIMVLSCIIAVAVVYAGLRILYFKRIVPSISNQFISGAIIGAAVCAMHYTGMHSATYRYSPQGRELGIEVAMAKFGSAYWVTIIAGIVKFVLLLVVQAYDRMMIETAISVSEGLLLILYNNKVAKGNSNEKTKDKERSPGSPSRRSSALTRKRSAIKSNEPGKEPGKVSPEGTEGTLDGQVSFGVTDIDSATPSTHQAIAADRPPSEDGTISDTRSASSPSSPGVYRRSYLDSMAKRSRVDVQGWLQVFLERRNRIEGAQRHWLDKKENIEVVSLGTLTVINQMLDTGDKESSLVFLDEKSGHILIKKDKDNKAHRLRSNSSEELVPTVPSHCEP